MLEKKREVRKGLIIFTIGVIAMCSNQNMMEDSINFQSQIDQAIQNGEFTTATQLISQYLDEETLSDQDRYFYTFERERFKRIRADFTQTSAEVLEYIKKYYPEVTSADIERWEVEKSLEFK